jgi:hypothetical protein
MVRGQIGIRPCWQNPCLGHTILAMKQSRMKAPPSMIKAHQILGWLAVFTIALVSLIPGDLRFHVGGSHYLHHFAAYFMVAIILAIGRRNRAQLITIAILLMLFAGILEIAQLWIPGRNSRIADFVASSLGIWIGILGFFFAKERSIGETNKDSPAS